MQEHTLTVRQHMITLLSEHEMSPRELSQELGIPEKDVYLHLPHIARSVAAQGGKLSVKPYQCLLCGYTFRERTRFTRPGRCPKCRQGHLESARYRINSG